MKLYYIVVLSLFLTACASLDDTLDNYDRSEVTKPYTLPKGMRSWSILTGAVSYNSDREEQEEEEENNQTGYINPLSFQIPVNDKFTWNLSPLPLGFTWSPLNHEKQKFAFEHNSYILAYETIVKYKYIFTPHWALEPSWNHFYVNIFFYEEDQKIWQLASIHQLNTNWAIKPFVGYGKVSGDSDFIDILFDELTGIEVDSYTEFDVFTYGLDVFYTINKQWDLSFGFKAMDFKDYSSANNPLAITLNFTRYWDGVTSGQIEKKKASENSDASETKPLDSKN